MHRVAIKETIEGWQFARCKCGMILACSARGKVYWLRAKRPAKPLRNKAEYDEALVSRCRVHDGRGSRAGVTRSS